MKELRAEIEIRASAQQVWRALTDFDSFPEWNPFISHASGSIESGGRLEVHIAPPGSRGMTFRPVLLTVEPYRELRWLGHLLVRGLFDGEHIFTIESIGERRVRFVQRERFGGILVPLLWRPLSRNTLLGFQEMNAALKARVEQEQSAGAG